jgi:hypothetical protein
MKRFHSPVQSLYGDAEKKADSKRAGKKDVPAREISRLKSDARYLTLHYVA